MAQANPIFSEMYPSDSPRFSEKNIKPICRVSFSEKQLCLVTSPVCATSCVIVAIIAISHQPSAINSVASSKKIRFSATCFYHMFYCVLKSKCTNNFKPLPWIRRLVASWQRNTRLDPSPILVGVLVDGVAKRQVFLQVLCFAPVSTISPIIHTHSFTINDLRNW